MWITLLVMAVAVSLEPFRIGMAVVMLNRPRPHLQLAAFLCGGFLMGLSVGAVVLFAVESSLLASAHFTLPTVQIVIGVLALLSAGLGIALPSLDYLAALAVIAAGNPTPGTRISALVVFNAVAFALVEIPLLAYLMAPERTRAAMTGLHRWIRARRRREVAVLLAVLGVVLLTAGLLGR